MSSTVTQVGQSPDTQGSAQEIERLAAGYTRLQRLLEISGVTVFFVLTGIAVSHITVLTSELPLNTGALTLTIGGALVAALLFADFASGFVHWAADNWGSADWPVLGAAFIRPFRLHHLDAQDITRHTFAELNGNNCLVSLPTFFIAEHCLSTASWGGLFWGTFWLGVAWWVLGTNQFHAWAHTDVPPPVVRLLQRSRLILSTPHHNQHHAMPHDRNYCITNGWLNGPLRALRFFEGIEWTVFKLTGIRAQHTLLEAQAALHAPEQMSTPPSV